MKKEKSEALQFSDIEVVRDAEKGLSTQER